MYPHSIAGYTLQQSASDFHIWLKIDKFPAEKLHASFRTKAIYFDF